jgi:GT2 family glycosyltransferase
MPLIEHDGRPPETCETRSRGAGVSIAVPAKDEEERIGACLAALEAQTARAPFSVVVLANNCRDQTAALVRALGRASRLDIHLYEMAFRDCATPAARARRLSTNAAAALVGHDGVVMTTDADSRVDPDWVEANLRALRGGADLVCGAISPDIWDAGGAFPESVLQRGVFEFQYEQLAAELEYRLDPTPWDPWPHHRCETGASLAVTAAALAGAGGVPEVEPGEDRALVNIVRRQGGRVRHAPDVKVVTSCRLDGRARGGWADDLRERVQNPAAPCHDVLEPTLGLVKRARLRGQVRAAWDEFDPAHWARRLWLDAEIVREAGTLTCFGAAWAEFERLSPRLARRRLEIAALPRETAIATRILDHVRAWERRPILA